jgi:hypothetical protein
VKFFFILPVSSPETQKSEEAQNVLTSMNEVFAVSPIITEKFLLSRNIGFFLEKLLF